jgi:hypothetical protein
MQNSCVADPDPGSGAFLTPGSGSWDPGWVKNQDPAQIIFPRASKPIFVDNILKFFDAGPGWKEFESGIRDPGWKKFGSGINIPDPQHCKIASVNQKLKVHKYENFVLVFASIRPVYCHEPLIQFVCANRSRYSKVSLCTGSACGDCHSALDRHKWGMS